MAEMHIQNLKLKARLRPTKKRVGLSASIFAKKQLAKDFRCYPSQGISVHCKL